MKRGAVALGLFISGVVGCGEDNDAGDDPNDSPTGTYVLSGCSYVGSVGDCTPTSVTEGKTFIVNVALRDPHPGADQLCVGTADFEVNGSRPGKVGWHVVEYEGGCVLGAPIEGEADIGNSIQRDFYLPFHDFTARIDVTLRPS